MEEQRDIQQPDIPEEEVYTPRPMWQVWGARAGLVVFILFVIYQLIHIATGGQV